MTAAELAEALDSEADHAVDELTHTLREAAARLRAAEGLAEAVADCIDDFERFLDRGLEVPAEFVESYAHRLRKELDAYRGGGG